MQLPDQFGIARAFKEYGLTGEIKYFKLRQSFLKIICAICFH